MALRSQNWRIRVEQPLAGDGVGAKAHPYRPSDRDHVQQRNGRDEGANGSELSPSLPEKPSLRSEDDPRTLQAIAEGRRLYVGNLPYIAKTRDVESLFEGENYQMFANTPLPVTQTMAELLRPENTSTCPSIHTQAGIHLNASSNSQIQKWPSGRFSN